MNREWEYYNHALIPTTAPHENPDPSKIEDKNVWRKEAKDGFIVFARWTTDFDCGYETNWWFIIKDAPFDLEELSKQTRKNIRRASRNCVVKKICADDCIDDLFRVYEEAFARYQNADNKVTYDEFCEGYLSSKNNNEYWGAYDQSGRLIGYFVTVVWDTYVEISVSKFSAQYMKLRASDALYYTILDYYLNKCGKKYVSSGQRSINHITNTQDYVINTFKFRKAYCKIHVRYNPKYRWLICFLYPMRNLLRKFEGITLVHQIVSVLRMEEIIREGK